MGNVIVEKGQKFVSVKNEYVGLNYDRDNGLFDFIDQRKKEKIISRASATVNFTDGTSIATNSSPLQDCYYLNTIDKHNDVTEIVFVHGEDENHPSISLVFKVYPESPYLTMQLKVRNGTSKRVSVNDFQLLNISHKNQGSLNLGSSSSNWSFYHNGLTSFGKTNAVHLAKGTFNSFWMSALKDLESKKTLLIGFATMKDQLSEVVINVEDLTSQRFVLTAKSHADGYTILPFGELVSEKLFIDFSSSEKDVFSNYARFTGKEMEARTWEHVPTGWCSFYYYHTKFGEKEVVENAKFLSKNKGQVEYILIDSGYHLYYGDWTVKDKKFPHGLKWLAKQIHEEGLKAILWVAPFRIGGRSCLYREHPAWIMRNDSGEPIVFLKEGQYVAPSYRTYAEDIYSWDPTVPGVQEMLKELFTKVFHEWGFDGAKIDFLDYPLIACARGSKYYNPNVTRIQGIRKCLEIIREVAGDEKYLLGCGAPLGPVIGIVNGMRIGPDVGCYWGKPESWDTYNALGAMHSMRNTITRYWAHQNFWINDPDCLVSEDIEGNKLPLNELRCLVSAIGLGGGAVFVAADMPKIASNPEVSSLFSKVLPPYGQSARPLHLFEREDPTVFDLEVNKSFGSWHVVGIFNWEERTADIPLNLSDLGLPQENKYHIYEFWEGKYFGIVSSEITFKNMQPHSCKLLVIKEAVDRPQVLSVSMHITQGGAELSSINFDRHRNTLSVSLRRIGEHEGSVLIHVPASFTHSEVVETNATKFSLRNIQKNLIRMDVNFIDEVLFTLGFEKV